jgi:serine/threonine-protein kinase PpkA
MFEQAAPVAGTPYYISPEQAAGETTDERTDLYALGVMFYQMLTGDKPYVGDNAEQILEQHCDPSVPQLPSRLSRYQPLLDRMMAKSLQDRISSARELAELLEEQRQMTRADYAVSTELA